MTLMETLVAKPPLLRLTEAGALYIGNTRVTLEVVLSSYLRGESAEQIASHFDTLELADVHAAISYYLRHRGEVEQYLEQSRREADTIRAEILAAQPQGDIRTLLLARHKQI